MTDFPVVVDARGLLCPWPVLRLARAAREMGPGSIRLLADDPSAAREIAQICEERGWRLDADPSEAGCFNVVIS
jgi:tRNA 2-thiouridine synthesizing protein A